ncbi:MAG: DUF1819 family protein [Coriobacteriales bacterium]|nr:DUF1819 family protein [Coriobacteriales bacterium]
MNGSKVRIQESMLAIGLFHETGSWEEVRRRIIDENLFKLNTQNSRIRISQEIIKRLRTLTPDELAFLAHSYGDDRCAMFWVAICRTYQFMRDFSEQVVAGRYNKNIPVVTPESYEIFYEEQSLIHPELASLAPSSRNKVRTQTFLMLKECKLLNESGVITPLYPSGMFKLALSLDHIDDLLLFPGRLV